ncbi:hypothetical protein J0895_19880 [Phormidium pseudopriestleyi FRX01]|uniref:Uncharacterized protein n=1 Tax=Phormidium pseudopriestleyi FRX01 TaxID=1759528 RepID=A0ABS3FWD5_9CYAN|nr:hypothetical protein [Phormidium pseudopriestleyi]MBO0351294.1 hypothetical protein [Phormidium pseudopriestleyi FRX01]
MGSSLCGDRHIKHSLQRSRLYVGGSNLFLRDQSDRFGHCQHSPPTHSSLLKRDRASRGPHPNPPLAKVRGPSLLLSVKNLLL